MEPPNMFEDLEMIFRVPGRIRKTPFPSRIEWTFPVFRPENLTETLLRIFLPKNETFHDLGECFAVLGGNSSITASIGCFAYSTTPSPEPILALANSPDSLNLITGSRLKESMEPSFLLRFNVTLRHLLMRYYYQFNLALAGALALFHIQFSEEDSQKRILRIRLTGVHAFLRETKEAQIYLLGGKGNERLVLPLKRSCRLCQSEVHTADQLPLPRYGLDAPPARAGLSDGYDRTIDSHSSAFRLSYGIKFFSGKPTKQANLFYDRSFRSACLFIRARVLNISLAARSEPERISDRLEDPVSNAPLAFNSQGELSASSLVPRGEGPSNSEVGSQYTDTPVIDRDLSLVTGEHSEGKPALAFSTPTGISLGGSSEPLTLSPDHKPLGGW
ncbi:hypothetical protein L1987_88288 [Smallanthus sonchifolius]|nr:hypothetical protein L1987_88288 [Smallanthus sonchifolius]